MGVGLESVAVGIDSKAAPGSGGIKLGEAGKVPVGERLVEDGPQALGWL